MSAPLLCFQAGGEACCIVLAELMRVEEFTPLLPVPYAHPGFSGFRLQRDEHSMFPVFDLWGWTQPRRVFERGAAKAIGLIESQLNLEPMGFLIDAIDGTIYHYEPLSGGQSSIASSERKAPLSGADLKSPFPFCELQVDDGTVARWLIDPSQLEQACQALS